ncbi:hypothetical protein ACRALDRAFT_208565 [Sodiomyces alcalophilus JCM 7366]|uniref:uncharacterized protein n=1 Tax=Sodiomyces alcalophilus JCM 7366 TaxID=591952 RepID=UPI0039B66F9F
MTYPGLARSFIDVVSEAMLSVNALPSYWGRESDNKMQNGIVSYFDFKFDGNNAYGVAALEVIPVTSLGQEACVDLELLSPAAKIVPRHTWVGSKQTAIKYLRGYVRRPFIKLQYAPDDVDRPASGNLADGHQLVRAMPKPNQGQTCSFKILTSS